MRRWMIRWLSLLLLAAWLLSGCDAIGSALSPAAPTPLPTVVLDSGSAPRPAAVPGSGVTASGVVAAGEQARLAFAIAGKIQEVKVNVGDQVTRGQVLAQLEGQEDLQAAISAAELELAQAEQALKDLNEQSETGRVAAMQAIVAYERQLRDAQYALDNFTIPSNQAGLDAVAGLAKMKELLDAARATFEPYKNLPSGDRTRQDRKEDLDRAQADYNSAVRRLQLEYDLEVAQAQLDQALKDYEMYQAGPDPDKLRLAEARRLSAETKLSAAKAALARLALSAPFDATVNDVLLHSGEWVIPGQAVLSLVDLGTLQVKTTDLSERDVPGIATGQPVTVYVKALNQDLPGVVTAIAPLANVLGGDVVYQATITLDQIPDGLREGMSVEVSFGETK